ncbi:ComEC/Rec2 family competence protein [Ancylobacter sp. IITR112]|uniref:ComEC/Rec2 family competence protein n=1 Tax=Ancylobacter sp. IITR112 TaxID=3138073 RepID=UPI00352B71D3
MHGPPQQGPDDAPRRRARAAALGPAHPRGRFVTDLQPEHLFAVALGRLSAGLAAALARELDDRRGFLYLPIGFASGAALYFAAPDEPMAYAGWLPVIGFAGLAFLARARPVAFHLLALLAVLSAGFAVAALQVRLMAHPVLGTTLNAVAVSGYVEAVELRPRGSRMTLAVTRLERAHGDPLTRVRVTLAGRDPPAVGSHVSLRATLEPPPGPAYPGGFDFGRAIWLDGIGATGYALGRPQLSPALGPPPAGLALTTWLDRTRRAIAARIRAALPGEEGGVAVALVTGLRDTVPEAIEESMRVSGLSHVLSISGLHMALVASTVFFLARALLALLPELALYRPIKAWAALPAMASASFYLLLSGAEVATQRAYVMTLLVLAGIVLGRPALTLRTLAVAALGLLILSPRAVLDPGAQMSFAATLGLVAAYERFGFLFTLAPAKAGRWLSVPGRYIAGLVLASLAAGLATAPYAAYHFQRLAPLSLLANLGAMPVVSFIVMPAGLAGAVLMPFGWDDPAWRLMGWGLARMRDISDLVAALPGADRGVPAMPAASLIVISLALVVLCLARTRLVALAPVLALAGLAIASMAPRPDLFVDAEARTVAVRGRDGVLAFMGDRDRGVDRRFAVEQWLGADGARSRFGSRDLTTAAACDPLGCTLPLPDGRLVALSRDRESLEDDCRLAAVLVTPFAPPLDCPATIIYRDARMSPGAVAGTLRQDGSLALITARRSPGTRPWEPAAVPPPSPSPLSRRGATPGAGGRDDTGRTISSPLGTFAGSPTGLPVPSDVSERVPAFDPETAAPGDDPQ